MAVDHQALTDEVDNFDLLTPSQRQAARRTCAAFSDSVEDLTEVMMMLGIHPQQERDVVAEVSQPVLPNRPSAHNRRPQRD